MEDYKNDCSGKLEKKRREGKRKIECPKHSAIAAQVK